MNFRSRPLLDLCYEFDCLLQIEGVCTGGTGEPCHANWPEHGKGMGMKAHDCYAVPGCRACHMALDQGSKLSGEQRKDIWHRAFWKFLAMLWNRGMLRVSLHDTDGMCPNCVTPWKCNGPHEPATNATTLSEGDPPLQPSGDAQKAVDVLEGSYIDDSRAS